MFDKCSTRQPAPTTDLFLKRTVAVKKLSVDVANIANLSLHLCVKLLIVFCVGIQCWVWVGLANSAVVLNHDLC